MKNQLVFCVAMAAALCTGTLLAQEANAASDGVYEQLLDVTNFLGNYKEMASVSAEVSAARGKGSDPEFSIVMASVARYGISDVKGCMAQAFSEPPITREDAADLIRTFKTPMGQKVLELGQAMLINDIRHGSPQGPDPALVGALTDRERQELINIRHQLSFVHYGQLMASAGFQRSIGRCLMASKAVRESGVKM
jgi:hypothetical protein